FLKNYSESSGLPGPVPTHLQQLHLHLVADQVGRLPPLAALQVVGGDGGGHLGGVQGPLQPHLLGRQQVGLSRQLLHRPLELGLPEVDVLQAPAQRGGGILLGALGQGGGVGGQALRLVAAALGGIAVGEGLVVAGVVVLVPLLGQVAGAAEAGRGQAARGVRPRVQRRLVHLHGQLGHRHGLRRRLPGQQRHARPRAARPGRREQVRPRLEVRPAACSASSRCPGDGGRPMSERLSWGTLRQGNPRRGGVSIPPLPGRPRQPMRKQTGPGNVLRGRETRA
uniref:Uncharacterized protein n=1 Tax=Pelusios castaneus TaxID=367368 RepID=A0A8C8RP95_9SAUR